MVSFLRYSISLDLGFSSDDSLLSASVFCHVNNSLFSEDSSSFLFGLLCVDCLGDTSQDILLVRFSLAEGLIVHWCLFFRRFLQWGPLFALWIILVSCLLTDRDFFTSHFESRSNVG
jgi:hypothetical protein